MADVSPLARALGRVPSGLFILTTGRGDAATGLLASWVQQVGFEPPAVTVAVKQGRHVEALLRDTGAFCVSVLDGDSKHLLKHFGAGFEPGEPAFDGVAIRTADNGVPFLAEAQAHLACTVVGEATWTDHVVFCGRVEAGDCVDEPERPMTHVRRNGLNY